MDVIFEDLKLPWGMVIGITQDPLKEGARSAFLNNLSKSGLENYVVKCSQRPLLVEVS